MRKPSRICIAPDSFKGALDAAGVARAIAEGFRGSLPDAEFRLVPMADGGEGTVDAWLSAVTGAQRMSATVQDPLGRPVEAAFAYLPGRAIAVIEMAAASGLPLLAPSERNPLATSTFGTGELLRRALDLGAQEIILGIGGSATNDAGTGMATALGARFLDEDGAPLPPGGAALARLSRIDLAGFDPRVRSIRLRVACDVTNPLCGPKGASRVFGPQKGATPDDVATLDAALAHLAGIVAAQLGLPADYVDTPGSGAAGGLGFGLLAFCRAKLQRGVGIVADSVGLAGKMRGCDLVVTGEGRIDAQTPNGKTPAGVAAVARQLGVPAIAICGCTGAGWEAVREIGIREVFPVTQGRFDPAHPEDGAYERVFLCARDVAKRLFGGEPA